MKNKDLVNLSLKNVIRNKKNIFNVLLLSMFIILIIFVFSLDKSFNSYLKNGIEKNISYRTLFVNNLSNDKLDTFFKNLNSINHVVAVFPDSQYLTAISFSKIGNTDLKGSFLLQGAQKNTAPEVAFGTNLSESDPNSIICPINFYPKDNVDELNSINKNTIINMNSFLNKKIIIDSNFKINDGKTNELKIIGIYQNSPNFVDENVCYANYNTVESINKSMNPTLSWNSENDSTMVQVDNAKNVSKVEQKIYELGYPSTRAFMVDTALFSTLHYGALMISSIVILLAVIIITLINRKRLKDKLREINIYRSIGYNNNDIKKIIICENLIIGIISLILSLLITIILVSILICIQNYKPYIFSKLPIEISYISFVVAILLVFIVSFIAIIINQKRLFSSSIIEGIK